MKTDIFDPTIKRAMEAPPQVPQAEPPIFDPTINRKHHQEVMGVGGSVTPGLDKLDIVNRGGTKGSADFSAKYGQSLIKDPLIELKYMADKLMPGVADRYDRIGRVDNKIVYINPSDDKLYMANPGGLDYIPQVAASVSAHAPSLALAGAGSAVGPLGTGLGAAAGDALERGQAQAFYGDKQGLKDYTEGAALNFIVGAGGDVLGRSLASALYGRRIGKLAGDVSLKPSTDVADEAVKKAAKEKWGMDLILGESSENPTHIMDTKYVIQTSEKAGDKFTNFLNNDRIPQLTNAVKKFSKRLSSGSDDYDAIVKGVVDKVKKVRGNLLKQRDAAASRYYKLAKSESVSPELMGSLLKYRQGVVDASGETVKKAVLRATRDLTDKEGNPILNIGKLHDAKSVIDKYLRGNAVSSLDSNSKRIVTDLQKKLTTLLRASSKNYDTGYQTFVKHSLPIDVFDSTRLGPISKLEGEAIYKSPKMFFEGVSGSAPAVESILTEAKQFLPKKDFDDFLKAYFMGIWRGKGVNDASWSLGSQLYKRTMGNNSGRDIWKAAFSDEPERALMAEEFFDILRRTGLIVNYGSPTAPLQAAGVRQTEKAIQAAGGVAKGVNFVANATSPLTSIRNRSNAWIAKLYEKYGDEYIDAITGANPKEMLRELVHLRAEMTKGQKALPALMAFFGLSAEDMKPLDERETQKRREVSRIKYRGGLNGFAQQPKQGMVAPPVNAQGL